VTQAFGAAQQALTEHHALLENTAAQHRKLRILLVSPAQLALLAPIMAAHRVNRVLLERIIPLLAKVLVSLAHLENTCHQHRLRFA